MNMRKLLYSIGVPVLLLLSFVGFAQDKVITGRVTDSVGNGIANVSVTVKGAPARGTTTANDGGFSLSVPANATTLVFSSVGYAYREVPITGSSVNVSLRSTSSDLNAVVVIGYGTVRKKDLTGSVATVTAKDFQKGVITTPEQLIAGKVAGVQITSNGGQPGSGSTIRIRGGSSLTASNDPLIVLDGVPLDPEGINGASNPLSFINANDIESFTVLKDASAAAIYGARAANGVIIITTKKGRSGGAFRVNFNTVNSVSSITKEVPVLSAAQVRAVVNANGTPAQIAMLGSANTDWQKEIYRTAISTENNLSFSGGVKNLPYRVTVGYQYLNGILKTDHLQKTSLALVFNPSFFDDHLKVDINLKGSMEQTRFGNQGAIGTAVSYDPTQPVYSKSNRFGGYYEWVDPTTGLPMLNAARNPLGLLEQTFDQQKPMRSIGNIQFDYKFPFLPDLHANLNLGYDVSKNTGTYFVPDSAASGYTTGGSRNPGKQSKQSTVLDFYLNYVKDIKSIKSRLDLTAGYSYNDYQTKNYFYRSYKANGDTFPNTQPPTFAYDIPEHFLVSFFGRLNYTINEKYLFTATVRRDGSSRFGPNNKWGTFPSVAFAWKLKQESFMRESNTFSDLKLRLGYGITGQQEGIANYAYTPFYSLSSIYSSYIFGNTPYQGYAPSGFDANLKWEQTATYNAGLDYGFFNNRITGSIDVYLKKTTDLLNSVAQPAGTNFSAFILANVGSMDNKGVEFSINAEPIRNRNTTLDLNFNITYNKNTIKNLTVVPDDPNYIGLLSGNIAGGNGFIRIAAVGGPKNTFYLYKQVYDENGKPIEGLLDDRNRDGIINDLDRYENKSADPNVFLGFSPNLTHKKWNLGFVVRANFNNYVYNNVYSNLGKLTQIIGTYTTANGSVNYLETGFRGGTDLQPLSDYYLENGSFLRMDNINLGYNVGKINLQNATLRLSATVQNVFVITKYKGLDPEVNGGIDNNLYPRPRIYSLGVNLDF